MGGNFHSENVVGQPRKESRVAFICGQLDLVPSLSTFPWGRVREVRVETRPAGPVCFRGTELPCKPIHTFPSYPWWSLLLEEVDFSLMSIM